MLGQTILDPALACPGLIQYGKVKDALNMARSSAIVFSTLIPAANNIHAALFRAYRTRAQALIGNLEKTVGSLVAANAMTAQEQSELCSLMEAADRYAIEYSSNGFVAAAHAGMLAALDAYLTKNAPRSPAPKGRSALGAFEILAAGIGAIFVGTMGYYGWRRWKGSK